MSSKPSKKKLTKRNSKKSLFDKTISYTKKKEKKEKTPVTTDPGGQQVTFVTQPTQIPVQLPTQHQPTTMTWTRTDHRPGAQQVIPLPRPLANRPVPTITTTIMAPTITPPVITTLPPNTLPPNITLPDTTPTDTTLPDTTPTDTTLPPSATDVPIILRDPLADRDREKDDDTPPTITTTTPRTTRTTGKAVKDRVLKSRPGGTRFANLAVTGDALPLAGLTGNVQAWLQLQRSVQPEHQPKMRLIVDTLVGQGEGDATLTDLAVRINTIGDLYDRLALGQQVTATLDRDAQAALNLRARMEQVGELEKLIKTDQAETVPVLQLTALVSYLNDNPGLTKYLQGRGIGIAFDSATAKSQGGGVYDSGNIHLYGLESASPANFLRLLVHEAGHGTYQRRLIPEKHMPLAKFWDMGTAADLFDSMDKLDASTVEYQALVDAFNREETSGMWAELSEDAKLLYRAWSVLRRNNGEYLQGVNMGQGKSVPERKKYQADYFTEFCAESFMLTAMGDADRHYQSIMTDATVPDDVKGAWKTAMAVLQKHAKEKVLGRT